MPRTTTPDYCETLAELQWRRRFWISQANRATNAAKALLRRAQGWHEADDKGKSSINKLAAAVVDKTIAGKELSGPEADLFNRFEADMQALRAAIMPAASQRSAIEKEMKKIARSLPVWRAFAEGVLGLGELGLAVLIAEAGDLSNFPNPGKVWKRLGLAPLNGKAASTWRSGGGLSSDDWTRLGYSPGRRSQIYAVVEVSLMRSQPIDGGPYRAAYDYRRARTAETHPDWPKARSHNDASRYMTKRLVRDLWAAWRQTTEQGTPMRDLSAANQSQAA